MWLQVFIPTKQEHAWFGSVWHHWSKPWVQTSLRSGLDGFSKLRRLLRLYSEFYCSTNTRCIWSQITWDKSETGATKVVQGWREALDFLGLCPLIFIEYWTHISPRSLKRDKSDMIFIEPDQVCTSTSTFESHRLLFQDACAWSRMHRGTYAFGQVFSSKSEKKNC